jgi:hypothetical protein
MELNQVSKLGPGTSIWVWIVRFGKGKWWPGAVTRITAWEPFPIVEARFECRSAGKNGADGAAFIGLSTTRMRYLELRNLDLKGADRPDFVPASILVTPEGPDAGLPERREPQRGRATEPSPRLTPATPIKKSRSRRKVALEDADSLPGGK